MDMKFLVLTKNGLSLPESDTSTAVKITDKVYSGERLVKVVGSVDDMFLSYLPMLYGDAYILIAEYVSQSVAVYRNNNWCIAVLDYLYPDLTIDDVDMDCDNDTKWQILVWLHKLS